MKIKILKLGKEIAEGNTLREACENWKIQRWDNNDLYYAFKKSIFYSPNLDFDEENEMYNQFIESLTGEEMFEIMKQNYDFYEYKEVE